MCKDVTMKTKRNKSISVTTCNYWYINGESVMFVNLRLNE